MKVKGLLCEFISFLLMIFLYLPGWTQANDDQSAIRVKCEGTRTIELHVSDLVKFRRVDIRAKDHEKIEYNFPGVALSDIMKMVGCSFGLQLRGANMAQFLLAKSGDGYQVLFALSELDSSFSDRTIILAYQVDGKPLPANKGPFRIIVPGEKKPARWIWGVRTLVVKSVKE